MLNCHQRQEAYYHQWQYIQCTWDNLVGKPFSTMTWELSSCNFQQMTPVLAVGLTESTEIPLSTKRLENRHYYVLVKSYVLANKYFFLSWHKSLVLSLIPMSSGLTPLFPPGLFWIQYRVSFPKLNTRFRRWSSQPGEEWDRLALNTPLLTHMVSAATLHHHLIKNIINKEALS